MKNYIYLLMIGLFVYSCKPAMEDTVNIGPNPTLSFTNEQIDPYNIKFTNTSVGTFLQKFDFGNGQTSTDKSFTAYFPFSGDYTITLVGQGKGGTAETSKTIHIATSDPAFPLCSNKDILNLTGGCDSLNGKTWILDRHTGFHCVGPIGATNDTSWYQEAAALTSTDCRFDASCTFKIRKFVYENKTSNTAGEFKYGYLYANAERGMSQAMYGDICLPYTPPAGSWSLDTTIVPKRKTIRLTNSNFMILKEGASDYEICYLSKDTLLVRWQFPEAPPVPAPDLSVKHGYRYYRLIAKK